MTPPRLTFLIFRGRLLLSVWCLWPALLLLAAFAVFRLGGPEMPRRNTWLVIYRQREIADFRSKVIGASQMTRAIFAKIRRPPGAASIEEDDLTPEDALASAAQAQAVDVATMTADLEGERSALAALSEALALRRTSAPETAAAWAALQCLALTRLGDLDFITGHEAAALKRYQAILALAEETQVPLAWCDAAQHLAFLLGRKGRATEAEPLIRRLAELRMRLQGPADLETLACAARQALVLQTKGAVQEAEFLFRVALSGQERLLGKEHPDNLLCLDHLAGILERRGDFEPAIALCRRALRAQELALGREHPDTLKTVNRLGLLVWSRSDQIALETLEGRGLEMAGFFTAGQTPGAEVINFALAREKAASAEAESLFRRALQACERRLATDDPRTLVSLCNLGGLLAGQDRLEEAAGFLERAVAGMEAGSAPGDPNLLSALETLSRLREKQGRIAEALPLAGSLLDRLRRTQPASSPTRENVEKWIGELQEKAARSRTRSALLPARGLGDLASAPPHLSPDLPAR